MCINNPMQYKASKFILITNIFKLYHMVVSVINTERQLYHSIFSYEKGANSVSLRRQSGLREIKLLAQSAESERAKVLS